MNQHKMVFNIKNILFYTLGMVVISFGVVMMLRSLLGVSSWDTLHYSLHKLTGITVGEATIYVALTFTVMVVIGNKNLKYVGMAIPIFIVGYLIDLFNLVLLVNYIPEHIIVRVFTYIVGLLALPLGGSLLIISSFPAGVFDEFMLTLMKLFKSDRLVLIRVIMELTAVTVAVILGFIAGIRFGMFNIGTLIFSVSVGVLVKFYLKLFASMGLYTLEQKEKK